MSTKPACNIQLIVKTVLFCLLSLILDPACRKNDKETIVQVSTDQNLIDPSIKPAPILSYPANNAVGPFNVYTPVFYGCNYNCSPCDCDRPPHFYIQFNKMMDVSSFTSASIHCRGFGHPVSVNVLGTNGYFPPISAVVQFTIGDSAGFGDSWRLPYQVGAMYTVTLDTTVSDVNGNHLVSPYTFAFIPEPYFRILKSYPAAGDSITSSSEVRVQFNSVIDSTIFPSLHILPPVTGRWSRYFGDSMIVAFRPSAGFDVNARYSVGVDANARDTYGNSFQHVITIPFRTYGFHVLSTNPANGDTVRYLTNGVTITFTGPLATGTVAGAVTVQPSIDLYPEGWQQFLSIYSQSSELLPDTTYHISISTALQSADGSHLAAPYSFSFVTPPFRILYVWPNNDQPVGRTSLVYVDCNGFIDTGSVRYAFDIRPPVRGHFVSGSQRTTSFAFSPDTLYAPATEYRVVISRQLHSRLGHSIAVPDTAFFRTY